LSVVKSDIIKFLSNSYPNFIQRDLSKLVDIVLYEMSSTLARGERVEIRDTMTLQAKIQKARISRNPKTLEKINIPEKKTIHFKMSKDWLKRVNEKK
tara:strand:- start:1446 stop:1736 length:291 start_codon:yes stop_codon:yes gene_type:complete